MDERTFHSRYLTALTVLLCSTTGYAESLVLNEIIAKVNGDVITRSDLDRTPEASLRDHIDGLLLVQKAEQLGISVDAEVAKQITEIQRRSNIADPDRFREYIREQARMPYEDYRNELRNHLLRNSVLRELVGRNVVVPRAEVQKYYEEHKSEFVRTEQIFLSELFLPTNGKTEAETAAIANTAKDLSARAKKGDPLRERFREIGGFGRGGLDPKLEALVRGQPRGFVTDPIPRSDPAGILILRVEATHRAGQATFDEVEHEILQRLYGPKFEIGARELMTRLREEAFLRIKPGYADDGAAPGKDTTWTDPAQLKPETITKEEVEHRNTPRRLFGILPLPGSGSAASRPGTSVSK